MKFVPTICAICRTQGDSEKVFGQNIDEATFSSEVFSARRLPDRRSYQWVRCKSCGLLRSDPVLEVNLDELYEKSTFDYNSEVDGLKKAYSQITKRALKPNPVRGSVLEVGGGNGFYLEAARELGFEIVAGVEPSVEAVAAARADIKPFMIVDMLRENTVPKNSFDLVTMFHVMDHLPDPLETISICRESLKPGGTFLVAVHNSKSWSARLLKSRSPIVDVEHTFLYDRDTVRKFFEKAGYVDIRVGSYRNLYSLAYLIHLVPIPLPLKVKLINGPLGKVLRKIKLSVPLGNMWASGKRVN
jgi:SAM-dependent methyltransferase